MNASLRLLMVGISLCTIAINCVSCCPEGYEGITHLPSSGLSVVLYNWISIWFKRTTQKNMRQVILQQDNLLFQVFHGIDVNKV